MQAGEDATSRLSFDAWTIVLGLFGLANLVNGVWMLADPVHWYHTLPAGVPDFGPLNEHFIRDIGCAFAALGGVLAAAAVLVSWRIPACVAITGFTVLHAFVHVLDTLRGLVGPDHWLIDLPGVYVPALILSGVTAWLVKTQR